VITRVEPDPIVVQRQNDLFDLWHDFADAHADEPDYDPDDDPEFHAEARQIMGLSDTSRSTVPDEDDAVRADYTEDDELLRAMAVDGDEFQAYWTRGKASPAGPPSLTRGGPCAGCCASTRASGIPKDWPATTFT
jgi:hypothetical protein